MVIPKLTVFQTGCVSGTEMGCDYDGETLFFSTYQAIEIHFVTQNVMVSLFSMIMKHIKPKGGRKEQAVLIH